MTYGQCRDFVLKLLNQYTMSGAVTPPSYNCQADYLKRIPTLINDAMVEIATTSMKIPCVLDLESLDFEVIGDQKRYTLPDDFYQLNTGGMLAQRDGAIFPTSVYSLQGRKYLLVPSDSSDLRYITYYRYPELLSDTPGDDDALDNDMVTHTAIPYYVAARLVIHDDAFLYASFNNKYEDKLAKMSPGVTVQFEQINDVYEGVFNGGV